MTLIPETPCGNNTLRHRLAHMTGGHAKSVCMMAYGAQVAEGLAEGLRKGSGNMLTEMPKVGDEVRYIGDCENYGEGLTEGKTYVIRNISEYGNASFLDDFFRNRFLIRSRLRLFELVTESAPSIVDLVANLGRRLSEVEAVITLDDFGGTIQSESDECDAVNSPQHYKRGKYETIEVIEHITAGYDDPFVAYCVGNAVKYLDRAPYKHDNPAECLRKAAWYITRAAEHVDKQAEASV